MKVGLAASKFVVSILQKRLELLESGKAFYKPLTLLQIKCAAVYSCNMLSQGYLGKEEEQMFSKMRLLLVFRITLQNPVRKSATTASTTTSTNGTHMPSSM